MRFIAPRFILNRNSDMLIILEFLTDNIIEVILRRFDYEPRR